jgi:SAM-dependent methyltransferase
MEHPDISQERIKYHEILNNFVNSIPPDALVYDIGKSDIHNYATLFTGKLYKTIDIDHRKEPDILLDIERIDKSSLPKPADIVLMNGVIEYCRNPLQMICSCNKLLRLNGVALLGFICTGYPCHNKHSFRFTPAAAIDAVRRSGFEVLDDYSVYRGEVASYIYVTAKKTTETHELIL